MASHESTIILFPFRVFPCHCPGCLHPSDNASLATEVIHSVTARLYTQPPNTFIMISGDFNQVTLAVTLPTFKQFVSN